MYVVQLAQNKNSTQFLVPEDNHTVHFTTVGLVTLGKRTLLPLKEMVCLVTLKLYFNKMKLNPCSSFYSCYNNNNNNNNNKIIIIITIIEVITIILFFWFHSLVSIFPSEYLSYRYGSSHVSSRSQRVI